MWNTICFSWHRLEKDTFKMLYKIAFDAPIFTVQTIQLVSV